MIAWGKWNFRSLASLFKEVTVFKRLATPLAWYKCLNSQHAQKCSREGAKSDWGLWAESPKRVSRTVQILFRTRGNNLKQGFAPCKRLFWDCRSRGPKTPFAPSLSTLGHVGCLGTCTRPAGSQIMCGDRSETRRQKGEVFLLTVGAFLLTAKLLCLQLLDALSHCKQKAPTASRKASRKQNSSNCK